MAKRQAELEGEGSRASIAALDAAYSHLDIDLQKLASASDEESLSGWPVPSALTIGDLRRLSRAALAYLWQLEHEEIRKDMEVAPARDREGLKRVK